MSILDGWFKRPIQAMAFLLIFILICTLGISELEFDTASLQGGRGYTIIFRHYGVGPEEIERQITIPLEDSLSTMGGIKKLISSSELHKSRIDLFLYESADEQEAYIAVREAVDRIYQAQPPSVQRPSIFSRSGSENAFFIVSFSNPNLDRLQIRQWAEEEIKPVFSRIEGTGEIQIGGGTIPEVHVELNPQRLSALSLEPGDVAQYLQNFHSLGVVAILRELNQDKPVQMLASFSELEDIQKWPLMISEGQMNELGIISQISWSEKEQETISRIDGQEQVTIYIKSGGNRSIISTSNDLSKSLELWKNQGFDFDVIYDGGKEVLDNIYSLLQTLAIAIAAVMFFFILIYRRLSVILSAVLSIPFHVLATLGLLSLMSISIDPGILSGLGIAIGVIADSAIIIINACEKNNKARAIQFVMPALIASTITTIIVTIPLLFMPESSISIGTICLAFLVLVVESMLINLLFLPFFFSHGSALHVKNNQDKKKDINPIISLTRRMALFSRQFTVKKPEISVISLILSIVAFILVFIFIPRNLNSQLSDSVVFAHVEFESGSHETYIDENLAKISQNISLVPGVIRVESQARRENGSLTIRYDSKLIGSSRLREHIMQEGDQLYGANISISQGLSDRTRIQINIIGPDDQLLRTLASEQGQLLNQASWVSSSLYHFKTGGPVWNLIIDKAALLSKGISDQSLTDQIRWYVQGPVAIKWQYRGDEYDIRVKSWEMDYGTIENIRRQRILADDSSPLALSELITFKEEEGNRRINRLNRQRTVAFSIETSEKNIDTIFQRLEEHFESNPLPAGYGYKIDETLLEASSENSQLLLLVLAGISLIIMILAAQYESLAFPLLVLLSIPTSMILPLFVLIVTDIGLTSASLIALIVLSGLVVNNVILILDQIPSLRTIAGLHNQDYSAPISMKSYGSLISHALRLRLKSMMLTSASTILGTIPFLLPFAEVPELTKQMALVILFGVLGSIISAIVLIPGLVLILLKSQKRNLKPKGT